MITCSCFTAREDRATLRSDPSARAGLREAVCMSMLPFLSLPPGNQSVKPRGPGQSPAHPPHLPRPSHPPPRRMRRRRQGGERRQRDGERPCIQGATVSQRQKDGRADGQPREHRRKRLRPRIANRSCRLPEYERSLLPLENECTQARRDSIARSDSRGHARRRGDGAYRPPKRQAPVRRGKCRAPECCA